jgi:hypothetical protein
VCGVQDGPIYFRELRDKSAKEYYYYGYNKKLFLATYLSRRGKGPTCTDTVSAAPTSPPGAWQEGCDDSTVSSSTIDGPAGTHYRPGAAGLLR